MSKTNSEILSKRPRYEERDNSLSHPIHQIPLIQRTIKDTKGIFPYTVKRISEEKFSIFDQEVDEVMKKSVLLYDEIMKSKSSLLLYKEIMRKHKSKALPSEVEEGMDNLTKLHIDLFKYTQPSYKVISENNHGSDFTTAISSIAADAFCFIQKEADKKLQHPLSILKRFSNVHKKNVSWGEKIEDDEKRELIDKYTTPPKSKEPGPSI